MTFSSDDDFGFRDTGNPVETKRKNVRNDIDELEEIVITFLENIKSVPDKNGTLTIKWPNRTQDIDDNIQKVKDLLSKIRKNT